MLPHLFAHSVTLSPLISKYTKRWGRENEWMLPGTDLALEERGSRGSGLGLRGNERQLNQSATDRREEVRNGKRKEARKGSGLDAAAA